MRANTTHCRCCCSMQAVSHSTAAAAMATPPFSNGCCSSSSHSCDKCFVFPNHQPSFPYSFFVLFFTACAIVPVSLSIAVLHISITCCQLIWQQEEIPGETQLLGFFNTLEPTAAKPHLLVSCVHCPDNPLSLSFTALLQVPSCLMNERERKEIQHFLLDLEAAAAAAAVSQFNLSADGIRSCSSRT